MKNVLFSFGLFVAIFAFLSSTKVFGSSYHVYTEEECTSTEHVFGEYKIYVGCTRNHMGHKVFYDAEAVSKKKCPKLCYSKLRTKEMPACSQVKELLENTGILPPEDFCYSEKDQRVVNKAAIREWKKWMAEYKQPK